MLLSAIIPSYNRANLVGETLRSLLAQTLPADEIIVVDDGSTDDTAEIALSFGPAVRVIRQCNAGPAAARNTGYRASRGEFIHFFDSDDLAAPNKHETQLAAMQRTGADIAVGPWVQGRFTNRAFRAGNQVLQQRGLPRERDLVKALLTHWSIVPHSAMFRRRIVEVAGGFDEGLFGTEDQLMFLNCLLAGARVVHTPDTIEFYRLGEAGKITENPDWKARRLREWARFLLTAREACLAKGIEPLRWFGYRRRLWEVERELLSVGCDNPKLLQDLKALRGAPVWGFLFNWHRQIERWKGGLQRRLTGGRAHSSFRIGPMTAKQVSLLRELGYSCQMPDGLFKSPQEQVDPHPCVG